MLKLASLKIIYPQGAKNLGGQVIITEGRPRSRVDYSPIIPTSRISPCTVNYNFIYCIRKIRWKHTHKNQGNIVVSPARNKLFAEKDYTGCNVESTAGDPNRKTTCIHMYVESLKSPIMSMIS